MSTTMKRAHRTHALDQPAGEAYPTCTTAGGVRDAASSQGRQVPLLRAHRRQIVRALRRS